MDTQISTTNHSLLTLQKYVFIALLVFCYTMGTAQTLGDYRSAASGNWSATSTWQMWNGLAWTAAVSAPPTNNATLMVTILNGHSVTISASTALAKTVVEAGGQLTVNANRTVTFATAVTDTKLTVHGTLTNFGTIIFSGTCQVSSDGILDNRSTLTFSGNSLQLAINGTFRNSSSGISTATVERVQFNAGSVYEHAFTTTSGVIPNATWATGSTCRITGYTSNTGIPQNIAQAFYHFEWNTPNLSSTVTAPTFLSLNAVNGNVAINNTGSGVLNIQSLSTLGGSFIISGSSQVQLGTLDFQVAGDIIFATSSILSTQDLNLTLTSSTADQTVDVKGLTLTNFILNTPSHTVVLASEVNIKGTLTIASSNTTLASNGYLKLLSTNDEGYIGDASIASIPAGSSITGNTMIQRYMSNEGDLYRYLAAPVSNFSVSNFQNDVPVTGNFTGASVCAGCAASLYYYDAASVSYQSFPQNPQTNSVTFETGRGYSAFVNQSALPGPVTLHWSGTVNQGTIDLPVAYNNNYPNTSWNLAGNPYPSTVDWNKGQTDGTGWSFTNIAQSIAVRDNSTGIFQYYPDDMGNETFNNGQIAKGQAFWVRAIGPNPALQIREDAKISDVGTFYRKAGAPTPTDRLILVLSNGSATDRAYVKVVPAAASKMDYFDAPKMNNVGATTLNLSTLLPGGTLPLAINALDRVMCNDTLIVKMTGPGSQALSAGTYNFSLAASGVMNNFSWILRDLYLNSTVDLNTTTSYTFTVSTVPASFNKNRFQLIAVSKPGNLSLPVKSTTQLCRDTTLLKIQNTQSQATYALEINGHLLPKSLQGNDHDLIFILSGNTFSTGKNIVKVLVTTGCAHGYLLDSVVMVKSEPYLPQVQSESHCQPGSIRLTASNVTPGNSVRWYSSQESEDALGAGSEFLTPPLTHSKTYYIAGINDVGCEGNRIAVQAIIKNVDAVQINAVSDSVLQSSASSGNQWYFNDQVLPGATSATVHVKESGTYTVQVTVAGCTTAGQYTFTNLTTAVETNIDNPVLVYPNPVQDTPLQIEVPINVVSASLLNNMGAIVINNITFAQPIDGTRKAAVELSEYPAGIYFLQLKGRETLLVKLVKN